MTFTQSRKALNHDSSRYCSVDCGNTRIQFGEYSQNPDYRLFRIEPANVRIRSSGFGVAVSVELCFGRHGSGLPDPAISDCLPR